MITQKIHFIDKNNLNFILKGVPILPNYEIDMSNSPSQKDDSLITNPSFRPLLTLFYDDEGEGDDDDKVFVTQGLLHPRHRSFSSPIQLHLTFPHLVFQLRFQRPLHPAFPRVVCSMKSTQQSGGLVTESSNTSC